MQIYLPIAELPISVLLVLGLSGAVGFISGLFGVGGGFLLTHLLIFLDIPPAVAVATVAAQVAGSSTTGVLSYWRRLRADAGGTTGPWLLAPPSSPGMPEYLFGSPVIEDNNIVAHGSAVKSVAYGDFANAYLVHDAGLRIERSDEYAFNQDLVSFRGVWRLDGRIRESKEQGKLF